MAVSMASLTTSRLALAPKLTLKAPELEASQPSPSLAFGHALKTESRRTSLRTVAFATQGIKGVEPDLDEEIRDPYATAGEEYQADNTFKYGKVDGAHNWHEGDDGEFFSGINKSIEDAGGPTGIQKVLAWLFLPNLFIAYAFGVDELYCVLYTVLFLFAYIGLEMGKPEKPTNLEPMMYRKYWEK